MFYIFSALVKRNARHQAIIPTDYKMDKRRIWDRLALELMEKFYPAWTIRLEESILKIVTTNPYLDKVGHD